MLDLDAALRAKGLSDRKAGAEVLERWKRRSRLPEYPTAASVAAKLGKLRKGDATWWVNQRDALAALAELLTCDPAELIPAVAQRPSAIGSREFPELAELLPGQEPCAVRNDVGWLGALADTLLHQGRHSWVVAEHGAGKSLAVRVLRERHASRITSITTRRLFDAARQANANLPLLVEVESPDAATDAAALTELSKRTTSVCVLAPFGLPPVRSSASRWATSHWWMDADWRERLVAWAHARLPKPADLDTDDVLDWLDAVDPRGVHFRTPGHLLPPLARAYRAGLPNGPHALRDVARETLAQVLGADASPWIRRDGATAAENLIVARLERLDVGFEGLPAQQWASLLPTAQPPSDSAPGNAASAKKKRSKASEHRSQPTPEEMVIRLEELGLLHVCENGHLDFDPWVRAGLEREAIVGRVKSDRPEWSVWCVNDDRRDTVDDALDSLSPTHLVIAARQALSDDPSKLSTVAAIEALMSAFGRRMIDHAWAPPPNAIPVLQELGKRQLTLLASLPKLGNLRPHLPLTRHRPNQASIYQALWLAEVWTFSFAVKPPSDLDQDPGWRLPGWSSNLRLSDAAHELPFPVAQTANEAVAYERLLVAARNAVAACRDATVPDDVAWLALPWVVIDGHKRGWSLSEKSGALLVESGLGELIGRLLKREPEVSRVHATTTAWNGALRERDGNPLYAIGRLEMDAPALAEVIHEHLPEEVFASGFTAEVLEQTDLHGRLEALPPRLLRAMLPALAEFAKCTDRPIDDAANAVKALGHEDIDLLVDLAADKYSVGLTATARVWTLDPERALYEAVAALRERTDHEAYAWFYSAPPDRYGFLLDALQESPEKSNTWANRWLAEALPRAGAEAPRVFSLMKLNIAS